VKAADIARAYNITEFNVLKIIPLLVHGGFVKTMRGRHGGMRLARPAADIRIGDIIRLTEETHIHEAPTDASRRPSDRASFVWTTEFLKQSPISLLLQCGLRNLNLTHVKRAHWERPTVLHKVDVLGCHLRASEVLREQLVDDLRVDLGNLSSVRAVLKRAPRPPPSHHFQSRPAGAPASP